MFPVSSKTPVLSKKRLKKKVSTNLPKQKRSPERNKRTSLTVNTLLTEMELALNLAPELDRQSVYQLIRRFNNIMSARLQG